MAKGRTKSRATVYRTPALEVAQHVTHCINPFTDEARGKKIHDDDTANTFTFQARQLAVGNINANGALYLEYYPTLYGFEFAVAPNTANLSANGVLGGTMTAGTHFYKNTASGSGTLSTNAMKYRVVSWGIRITVNEAALYAKGRLVIRGIPFTQITANGDMSLISDDVTVVGIHSGLDLTIIPEQNGHSYGKWLGRQQFQDDYDSWNEPYDLPFRAVSLLVTGADTTGLSAAGDYKPLLNIDVVWNLECIPNVNTLGAFSASPAAPAHQPTREAISNTRGALPLVNHTKGLTQKIFGVAKQMVQMAMPTLKAGASRLLLNYLPPQARVPLMLTAGAIPEVD